MGERTRADDAGSDPGRVGVVPRGDGDGLRLGAFDHAPVGVAVLAPDGRFLRANRALCGLLGTAAEELLATTIGAVTHLDDAEGDLAARERLLAGAGAAYQRELRLLPKRGGPVWALLSVAVVRGDGGEPAYLVAHALDVHERRTLEERLRYRALHDPLTGLPNRILFDDRLAHALAGAGQRREGVAVLLADLDGFKGVNDRLGHAAGDQLLVAAGQRLAACLRLGDTAARVGGDEFALLLERCRDPEAPARVAARVLAAMRQPFPAAGGDVAISASVGVARSGTGQARASDLLRDADAALYRAKAAGKDAVAVHGPTPGDAPEAAAGTEFEIDLLRAATWLRAAPLP